MQRFFSVSEIPTPYLRYKETHLRLLAYLAAAQAKLNIWTAPFESLDSVESNLNDWIYFMEMQQFDTKLFSIADKMETVTEDYLKFNPARTELSALTKEEFLKNDTLL